MRYPQVISPEKPGDHIFRLTGPGADRDPKGLFTIDIDTGDVSVSRSLDREAIDSYQVSMCVNACEKHLLILFICSFFYFLLMLAYAASSLTYVTFSFSNFLFYSLLPREGIDVNLLFKHKKCFDVHVYEKIVMEWFVKKRKKSCLICNQMTQNAGSEI